jgi:hypothetical protein
MLLPNLQPNRQIARAIAGTRLRRRREAAPSVPARNTARIYGQAIRDKGHAAPDRGRLSA